MGAGLQTVKYEHNGQVARAPGITVLVQAKTTAGATPTRKYRLASPRDREHHEHRRPHHLHYLPDPWLPGVCSLRVSKIGGEIVLNPHVDGSCVLRLDETSRHPALRPSPRVAGMTWTDDP